MEGYKTVRTNSEFRLVEKKSEFIGYCAPVSTEAEAIAFVGSIKKKHSDARHAVYAYQLREGFASRYSDDGEPHGTAGMPVLDSIRKAGLTDAAIVVIRYFGGILLGTGGLVRAYTAAASGAIKEAGIAEVGLYAQIEIKTDYSDYQRVMPLISSVGARTDNSDFGTDVVLSLSVRSELAEGFIAAVTEATNGRAIAKKTGEICDFI